MKNRFRKDGNENVNGSKVVTVTSYDVNLLPLASKPSQPTHFFNSFGLCFGGFAFITYGSSGYATIDIALQYV